MTKINDVFFDLDRTLWDFERNSETALHVLYEEYKLGDYVDKLESFVEVYKEVNARYWKEYGDGRITKEDLRQGRFRDTLKTFNIKSEKMGVEMNDKYIEISPLQTHLFPAAKEVLTELKNQEYKLHIITNGFLEVQTLKLKNSGLTSFFESVLCSEEVGKNKPHPAVFQEAMRRAEAKAHQSMMIGDDIRTDIIGAENVGIKALLFDPYKLYENNVGIDSITSLSEIPNRILGIGN